MQLIRTWGNRSFAQTAIYALGRFAILRALVRQVRARLGFAGVAADARSRCVEPFDVDGAARDLASDSVHTGLKLRDEVLRELLDHIAQAQCIEANPPRRIVDAALRSGNATLAEPVILVDFVSEALAETTRRIARDEHLVAVASKLLGREPRRVEIRVQESLVAPADTAYREMRNQTVMFHYDVHGFGFVYAFFYLSDVDREAGAHELIRGSHRSKRLMHLLGSARRSDDEIYATYGRQRVLVVEGKAGCGFIEDTSCFHRALPPTRRSRLALQIRYA
ncbi:hypothetical protein [Ramlibacter sp. PS4R-6]|uniref:hypothetical protein n=1 Tax=Ramlibacter sp. PS4R-6 TaxID=3133438 RepID=UPI00309FE711